MPEIMLMVLFSVSRDSSLIYSSLTNSSGKIEITDGFGSVKNIYSTERPSLSLRILFQNKRGYYGPLRFL
jgi:hypothetical protein